MRLVVRVRVLLAMPESLGTGIVSIPEMARHEADPAGVHIGECGIDRLDDRIGFRSQSKRDDCLGKIDPPLRHADELDRVRCRDCCGQRRGVGQADVLRCQDHQSPGNEARVFSGGDHPSEIVQSGLYIRASNRLDEGADHVIVLITGSVVTDCRPVHCALYQVGGDHGLLHGGCACSRLLQEGQGPPRVSSREPHDHGAGFGIELILPSETAVLVERTIQQRGDVLVAQRLEGQQ
jgi:hypothetical protein